MASVDKRPPRTPGGAVTYRVRYRDPSGASRSQSFARKPDAEIFKATVEADKHRGMYVDPSLGKMTLGEFADSWLASQTFDESTREATALRIRLHVKPALGSTRLVAVSPSQVQAWVRGLQQTHAPRTVRVIFANLSSILSAAVDDGRLPKNPCRASSIRLPRVIKDEVVPWTVAEIQAVQSGLPPQYQALVTLGAGCGLRQGEIFGLAVDDVDFLRGVVHVRRQVKIVGNQQVFALPKGGKKRDVTLPENIKQELAAHLAAFPGLPVTLPWKVPSGPPATATLVLTSRQRRALNRNYVNKSIWQPAVEAAGIAERAHRGMHMLRHSYASMMLNQGCSIVDVAARLGHADPGFTLRVYTHLMPDSEDRTKRAIERAFAEAKDASDSPFRVPNVSPSAP